MCTLTLWPEGPGYRLAMNRDEQRSRLPAAPPFICFRDGCRVVAPLDPAGGTWIAANDSGVTFALLNWYEVDRSPSGEPTSRGAAVISLSTSTTVSQAVDRLGDLQLRKVRPFRLVGCFPREGTILEWRWNLHQLSALAHPWKPALWASSGYDEAAAERERRALFSAHRRIRDAGSSHWLRHLHQAHGSEAGPSSICMHRTDAASVSYTEVCCQHGRIGMTYVPGQPCLTLNDGHCTPHTVAMARTPVAPPRTQIPRDLPHAVQKGP